MKALAPAWLRWWTLLPFDFSLVCVVVVTCVTVFLAQVQTVVGKVRMSAVLVQMSAARYAATEKMALSGELVTSAPFAPETDPWSVENIEYRIAGTNVVARGKLRGNAQEFTLAVTPAVSEEGLSWNVIWLCGLRRAPDGWKTQTPPLTEHLSAEQLPFVCRDLQG
jgi:hypothetical protein